MQTARKENQKKGWGVINRIIYTGKKKKKPLSEGPMVATKLL